MRKATIVGAAVVAAALIAVAVAAAMGTFAGSRHASTVSGTENSTATGHARIIAASGNPIRVVGMGFKRGEHVRVKIAGNQASQRRVTASAKGAFAVKLKTGSECPSLTVDAIGDRGSRASFNISSFVCR